MTVHESKLHIPREEIKAFCRRHPIIKLSLFGSALREDFHDKSDLDFLVEFLPGVPVTYFLLAGMEIELEKLTGRRVDLRLPGELNHRFRDHVLESAEELYVAPHAAPAA
jgi:predicted nucleotidyltransferase